MKKIALVVSLVIALSACSAPQDRNPGTLGSNKTTGGTLLGAVGGGLLGSQVGSGSGRLIAVGAGTLLGALLGHGIGESLDKADVNYAQRAQNQAHVAPIGQTISWSNPESGRYGSVTPTREGRDTSGRYCREYQQELTVEGKTQQGYGIACKRSDGQWEIMN